MQAPSLIKPIPTQIINVLSAFGPVDLKQFIQTADGGGVTFVAQLDDGRSLPQGLICTQEGLFTGIPAKTTEGTYKVLLTATNAAGSIETNFALLIKASIDVQAKALDDLKKEVWKALQNNTTMPDVADLYSREITGNEIYYLLERWGVMIAWDAFNLEPPAGREALLLSGASEHYHIYDCGSCIIASPKDLYSHDRTLFDALITAKAVAKEIYQRGWTVQLAGVERMIRAAWVEIQHLGDKYGKKLEVINFEPKPDDILAYQSEALALGYRSEG